ALKVQGQDVTDLEQEFNRLKADLEQMQEGGVAENHLMTFLAPFGEKVAGALKVAHPTDPDKNKGVFNPSRTQSDPLAPITQAQPGLSDAERNALADLAKMRRDNKITELAQSADPTLRPYLQTRLQRFTTAEEVAASYEQVVQDARDLLSIG